ncbi:hypothetical protein DY000_02033471 [Brassica cretica]|uniref:Uncharacterized protein n=1 Tax=Brassica cretica TaxID=69181 RepID=A0ABQ7DTQ7_BRACR|nr:hypothetical protein DY000_02033471 [Brassica cretica]
MKESKIINRKRAKREQGGLISEFAFEREQQAGIRFDDQFCYNFSRSLSLIILSETRHRRSVLAHGGGDLGAGCPRPRARSIRSISPPSLLPAGGGRFSAVGCAPSGTVSSGF